MPKLYQPIASEEERLVEGKVPLSPFPEKSSFRPFVPQSAKDSRALLWFCHGGLLLASFTLFALAVCFQYDGNSNNSWRLDTPYSPAASIVKYQTTRYDITPMQKMTEYIGYGPEVDRAWDHITYDVGDQMITRKELDRLGLDPQSLKVKNPKTGQEGYRVGIQVFHQLHCLNLLRQSTYKEEYYSFHGGDIEVEPSDLRGHLDHCIEILRVSLMCQSDIGVFPFKYYEGFDGHWPDFSTLHTCRNFDAIRNWAFENAAAFGNEE